jgi:predicted negative regulator of RcsB-dependent stress response
VGLEDPYYGEALYYAYQGDYFRALERLDSELAQHYAVDEPDLDSLYPYLGQAEFSVGDFELYYRMHLRAGRAMRAVLEGEVDESVRADAALRLARLHFQKNQPDDALAILDAMHRPTPEATRDDAEFLRANVLMELRRPSDAVEVLSKLQGSNKLVGFSAYNLGIAFLESGRYKAAVAQLDRAGRVAASDRQTHAIRDKSNLVLGTLLFEAAEYRRAQSSLERVRLDGPFSNQALLRAGWAKASAEQFDRALVPWSLLAERDATDSAVQEALIAVPYAYSKLNVHGRAAVLYERAASAFGSELGKLNASIDSIQRGEFLKALDREEIRKDKDWVIRLRSLPEAPETFYLVSLMASNDFQTALQNYLDLVEMHRKLVDWKRSLEAFADLIRLRRAYYEPRMPGIDQHFRKLDAQRRLRLEQIKHLDQRLNKMLTAPAPEVLATAKEYRDQSTIERLESALESTQESESSESLRARIQILKGVLTWRLETQYHERLTEVHDHLRQLNDHVDALSAQYDAFVRTRQAATHSYAGYGPKIHDLRERVEAAIDRLDGLQARQGQRLESMAMRELNHRRGRLLAYQNKARFAFADSYDRAAKTRAR